MKFWSKNCSLIYRHCSFSSWSFSSAFFFCFQSCLYAIKNVNDSRMSACGKPIPNRGNHENGFVFTDRHFVCSVKVVNERHLRIYHLSQLIKLKELCQFFYLAFAPTHQSSFLSFHKGKFLFVSFPDKHVFARNKCWGITQFPLTTTILFFFSVCEFHPLTLDNPITRTLHNNLWMRESSLGTEETSTIISNNRHILSSSLGHTTQVNLILSVFAIFFMHNFEGRYYKYTLLFSKAVHLAVLN